MNGVVVAETVRRHLTNGAFFAGAALLAVVSLAAASFDKPASMWPSLIALLAFIVGCGPIGPEFSSGTLQLILVKPVNRAVYLLSRVAGVVLVVWLAALGCAACESIGRLIWGHGGGWIAIGTALLNVFADTVLTVSLLTLLGALTRAYFNVAIYFMGMVGLNITQMIFGMARQSRSGFGRFLSAHPGVERGLAAIDANLFPDLPQRLTRDWMTMVLCNAAVALVLACLAFRRREVPYGAE